MKKLKRNTIYRGAASGLFSYFCYTAQVHLPRDETAHSALIHPTLTSN